MLLIHFISYIPDNQQGNHTISKGRNWVRTLPPATSLLVIYGPSNGQDQNFDPQKP